MKTNDNITYIVNTISNRVSFLTSKNYSNINHFLKGNQKEYELAMAANKKISDCFQSFIHKYNDYINDQSQPIKKLSLKETDVLYIIMTAEQDSLINVMNDIKRLGQYKDFNKSINSKLDYNNNCFEELLNLFNTD
ncbi:MAG: hypothetical protein K2X69_15455 [Silvanigrellaceae bacterium]|nr:hypothetical protein [Silvanigrellaceae bacterium]